MNNFTHPVHARGVRSAWPSSVSTPLTDAAIQRYALRGFYGEATRLQYEAALATKKNPSPSTRARKTAVSAAKSYLDSILNLSP